MGRRSGAKTLGWRRDLVAKSARLPADLWRLLEVRARRRRTSVNRLIVEMLGEALTASTEDGRDE